MSSYSRRRQRNWAIAIAGTVIVLALVLFGRATLFELQREAERARVPSEPRPWLPDTGDAPGPEDLVEVERIRAEVHPDRASRLESAGGLARLDLPPGSVSRPTTVELVRYAIEGTPAIDPNVYDLQPDGLSLRRPAEVRLSLPLGVQPDEVELAVFDPVSGVWRAEAVQARSADGRFVGADVQHFSLRRLRLRPGMAFPRPASSGRATFYLETDPGNTFERYVENRWRAVRRSSSSYRELMALDRVGRHSLIAMGRLRAITAARPRPEIFLDERRTVAMPAGAPEARTGWVEIERLDGRGEPTGRRVVARVNDFGPGPAPRRAGVILDMSRATTEALGLRWGEEFGVAEDNPNLAWISIRDEVTQRTLHYVPVRVSAYEARPERTSSSRLR